MAAPPRGRRRGVLRRRRRTASTASRKSQRPLLLIRAKKKKKKKETLLKLSFFSFPSKFCYQGGKVGPAVQPVAKTLPPFLFDATNAGGRRRAMVPQLCLALASVVLGTQFRHYLKRFLLVGSQFSVQSNPTTIVIVVKWVEIKSKFCAPPVSVFTRFL